MLLTFKSPKMGAKSRPWASVLQVDSAQGGDLAPIFGDFSQSEKLSEFKPALILSHNLWFLYQLIKKNLLKRHLHTKYPFLYLQLDLSLIWHLFLPYFFIFGDCRWFCHSSQPIQKNNTLSWKWPNFCVLFTKIVWIFSYYVV